MKNVFYFIAFVAIIASSFVSCDNAQPTVEATETADSAKVICKDTICKDTCKDATKANK